MEISNNNAEFLKNTEVEETVNVTREPTYPIFNPAIVRALTKKMEQRYQETGKYVYRLIDVSPNNEDHTKSVHWYTDCLELRNDLALINRERRKARTKPKAEAESE